MKSLIILSVLSAGAVATEISTGKLQLQHSSDGVKWTTVMITPEMLSTQGDLSVVGITNPSFFRLAIQDMVITPAVENPMITVAGGTFTRSFFPPTAINTLQISRHEVTWADWLEVRFWSVANGYDIADRGKGCTFNHPVHTVTWYDVVKWCNAKSEKEGLAPVYTVNGDTYKSGEIIPAMSTSANGYRLPLEAEWYFAAVGGNLTSGYTYSGSNFAVDVGWLFANAAGADCPVFEGRGTWPVGQKLANELGLTDMTGNVAEWCWDFNPQFPATRYVTGGSFTSSDSDARVTSPTTGSPNLKGPNVGFRIARNAAL